MVTQHNTLSNKILATLTGRGKENIEISASQTHNQNNIQKPALKLFKGILLRLAD